MILVGSLLVALPIVCLLYAYLGYPAIMWLVSRSRPAVRVLGDPPEWPEITIVLPVYNEAAAIAHTLESLLAIDYPAERRHILVVSDCSSDGTDDIVRSFSHQGIRLLRLTERGGKTAAENAAGPELQGTIAVNTDATIRILPHSLKELVRVFQDPTVGVASGRDISVSRSVVEENRGESGYVDYEMWLRSVETRAGSIVGASGCCYAIRRELFDMLFPSALSRDFASALIAVEHGFRAVSVDGAVCLVPRTGSLRAEYRRKVRTMARGLETLWFKRHLLFGGSNRLFAFQLLSHKLIRWLVFLAAPGLPIGLALLALADPRAWWALGAVVLGLLIAALAFLWPHHRPVPRPVALLGFVLAAHAAGFMAWTKALRGELNPVWEPTRRTEL